MGQCTRRGLDQVNRSPERSLRRTIYRTPLEHSDYTKIFINIGPVDTHRHELEIRSLLVRCRL